MDILHAVETNDAGLVAQLLQGDPALARFKGVYEKTGLHLAAEKNFPAIAGLLLNAGADLEARTAWGMTPLEWAANMGINDVADLLLAHGAQLNMWAAAGLGMLDRVHSFWDATGALKPGSGQRRYRQEPDGRWTELPPPSDDIQAISDAFYIACRNGHTDVARFLLQRGADINYRGFSGGTGLHWAAINGHKNAVEFLIGNDADLNMKDDQFHAGPIGWAQEGCHTEIIELLRRHGATV